MHAMPERTLQTGDRMPILGIGTAGLEGATATDTVRTALDAGYTHIDTAEGYRNERAVGDALTDYDRDDLFLTSKVLPSNLHYESVIDACENSLDRLGTDYLDLYLVHWPNPAISLRQTLQAMERLHERGLVRNVGVSNFSEYQLQFARKIAGVPISVNQIEYHPWWTQPSLREHCHDHGIVVTAAAPLGQTGPLGDPVVQDLAETYDKEPAQVVLRWHVQQDIVAVPRSTSAAHIEANARVFDWELDPADVARIDGIERREKVYDIDLDSHVYGTPE